MVKLGLSACLLGEKTRYDGRDKLDPFLTGTLGMHVRFVPVCPEVECGLGVPREPMRLEERGGRPGLFTVGTGRDLTAQMEKTAGVILERLEEEGLWGFIFKSRSPSCGPSVAVHGAKGPAKGMGIFRRLWEQRFPLLAAEDEDRMRIPDVRSHFIVRLFVLARWRDAIDKGMETADLLDFHGRHALLLLSQSRSHFREMERLVDGVHRTAAGLEADYSHLLLGALAKRAGRAGHAAALRRASAHLKGLWTQDEKQETEERIAAFRAGLVPLLAPQVLLGHYATKYDVPHLARQHYLKCDPAEAMLLYHA